MTDFAEREADALRACLLAGALGDALGAHVEFLSWRTIASRFGSRGITSLQPTYGRVGAATDDTQMTLFTLEALIRWHVDRRNGGNAEFAEAAWQAYCRWLITQDTPMVGADGIDGWLLSRPWLHSLRGPGGTNLRALRGGIRGRLEAPINDSRGCGGVMRSAPLGLFAATRDEAFMRGLDSAVVTHSDAGGYLPAAILAAAIFDIVRGADVEVALRSGADLAASYDDSARSLDALAAGIELGRQGLPTPEQIHTLRGGWEGQDALAIAAACTLTDAPLMDVLVAAANHDGDSDSTASIAGQIVGARHGMAALAGIDLSELEGRDDIETLCADAVSEFGPTPPDSHVGGTWWLRYPGVA